MDQKSDIQEIAYARYHRPSLAPGHVRLPNSDYPCGSKGEGAMIRVLIADDTEVVRRGLALILRESLPEARVQEVAARDGLMAALAGFEWDVLFLNTRLSDADGLDVLIELQLTQPELRVIGLHATAELAYATACLDAGAAGFVSLEAPQEELVDAVHVVLAGHTYVCREVAQMMQPAAGDD
jgi:two-component system, NarL family, invasion response regulator UvrY